MGSVLDDSATNESLQSDEVQALSAIFDKDWVLENSAEKRYSMNIKGTTGNSVYFEVVLSDGYPLVAPPVFTISAPWMSRDGKNQLSSMLEEIYCANLGQSIIYLWIVKIQEFLEDQTIAKKRQSSTELTFEAFEEILNPEINNENTLNETVQAVQWTVDELPQILHGEPIIDRKSVFQAHFAKVVSKQQVNQILLKLKENRKIAVATHNIYAYRINRENNSFIQDCDDDGESKGGSVLLHLLERLNACDVLVVVSRWYGGIHLGPDRFKHISNAARNLLSESGVVTEKLKNTPSKSKKK